MGEPKKTRVVEYILNTRFIDDMGQDRDESSTVSYPTESEVARRILDIRVSSGIGKIRELGYGHYQIAYNMRCNRTIDLVVTKRVTETEITETPIDDILHELKEMF